MHGVTSPPLPALHRVFFHLDEKRRRHFHIFLLFNLPLKVSHSPPPQTALVWGPSPRFSPVPAFWLGLGLRVGARLMPSFPPQPPQAPPLRANTALGLAVRHPAPPPRPGSQPPASSPPGDSIPRRGAGTTASLTSVRFNLLEV